jgi:hypothetical protein
MRKVPPILFLALVICCVLSGASVLVGILLIHPCPMPGCGGPETPLAGILAVLSLLAPLLIFPSGAFLIHNALFSARPTRHLSNRVLLITFAVFPLLFLAIAFGIQRTLENRTRYYPHEGVNTQYYANGHVAAMYTQKDGEFDGEYTALCSNGKVQRHGFWEQGSIVGRWEERSCEVDWNKVQVRSKQGVLIYTAQFTDGVLREETNGQQHPFMMRIYNPDGELDSIIVDGKRYEPSANLHDLPPFIVPTATSPPTP